MGTSGNVFEGLLARRRTLLINLRKFKEFGIVFSQTETSITMILEREMRRESQNSSMPVPHFHRRGGKLNHTGGTYSHGGMVGYTRLRISEIHPGKFPDSMEFQSWKVNFKTEVCSKSQCNGSKKLR